MQETQETQVLSLSWEDPLEEGMATHSSILAWSPMDRGAWWAIVHGVPELDMTEDTHLLHSLAFDVIFSEVSYIGRANIFVELKIIFTFLFWHYLRPVGRNEGTRQTLSPQK